MSVARFIRSGIRSGPLLRQAPNWPQAPALHLSAREYTDEMPKDFDPRDMCCMSGCAHCVLDDLYEEATKAEAEGKDVSKIDPAIKAFMDMEKKQKEKARLREEAKKLKEAQNEVPS